MGRMSARDTERHGKKDICFLVFSKKIVDGLLELVIDFAHSTISMMGERNIKKYLLERYLIDARDKYIVMLLFRSGMIELKKYWVNTWICRNMKFNICSKGALVKGLDR